MPFLRGLPQLTIHCPLMGQDGDTGQISITFCSAFKVQSTNLKGASSLCVSCPGFSVTGMSPRIWILSGKTSVSLGSWDKNLSTLLLLSTSNF